MSPKKKSVVGKGIGDKVDKDGDARKNDDVYKDEDADVVLVSSDNTVFRVHGFYLMAASPVFRDMLGSSTSGANGEVEFTDEKLECATTIRALLDYICKPFGDFDSLPCDTRFSLIRVAEKYDCSVLLQAITLHTEHSVGCKTHLWERFFYACALDNIEVAHRLLPAAAGFTWSSGLAEDIASVNQNITGASVLDITSMSSAWMDYLPRKYLLALIRASRLRVPSNLESWSAVADEFKKQVNLQNTK